MPKSLSFDTHVIIKPMICVIVSAINHDRVNSRMIFDMFGHSIKINLMKE